MILLCFWWDLVILGDTNGNVNVYTCSESFRSVFGVFKKRGCYEKLFDKKKLIFSNFSFLGFN